VARGAALHVAAARAAITEDRLQLRVGNVEPHAEAQQVLLVHQRVVADVLREEPLARAELVSQHAEGEDVESRHGVDRAARLAAAAELRCGETRGPLEAALRGARPTVGGGARVAELRTPHRGGRRPAAAARRVRGGADWRPHRRRGVHVDEAPRAVYAHHVPRLYVAVYNPSGVQSRERSSERAEDGLDLLAVDACDARERETRV
jgi:hypothetical protein